MTVRKRIRDTCEQSISVLCQSFFKIMFLHLLRSNLNTFTILRIKSISVFLYLSIFIIKTNKVRMVRKKLRKLTNKSEFKSQNEMFECI